MDRIIACDVAEGAATRDGLRLASIFTTAAVDTDVEDSASGSISKKLCMDPPLELSVLELPPLLVPLAEFSAWNPPDAIACWKSLCCC